MSTASTRYKVVEARTGKGDALLFFNVAIGSTDEAGAFQPEFVVRDFVLKKGGKSKRGYYYQAPSKIRQKKNANNEYETVMEKAADGSGREFPKRDNIFDLYGQRTGETFEVTKTAWDARDSILDQAMALLGGAASESAGRGTSSTTASATKAKPTATSKTGATAKKSPVATSDEDDDLPF